MKPPPPVRVRRAKPVKAEPKDGPSDLTKRSTHYQVEAKMAYMRTNAGRIELIDRLEGTSGSTSSRRSSTSRPGIL